MRRIKLSRWIFGFFLICILTLIVLEIDRSTIEMDLTERTKTALNEAGIEWGQISFSGRDAMLEGSEGKSKQEIARAIQIVKNVYGVRIVKHKTKQLPNIANNQKTKQLPLEKPYRWMAVREEGGIKLKAFVPTEEDRKTILGFAKASVPTLEIIDKMKLARGVPSHEVWLSGVSFGLKQINLLKKGRVHLHNNNLTIEGVAKDSKSYELLQKIMWEFEIGLETIPAGITLEKVKVKPPKAKPYIWSLKLKQKQITLSGHVPNQNIKKRVLQCVEKAFPNFSIVDAMSFASGSPKNWEQVVQVVTKQFTRINNGEITISNKTIKISAFVSDEQVANQIENEFVSSLPKGFDVNNDIKIKEEKKTTLPQNYIFAHWSHMLQ